MQTDFISIASRATIYFPFAETPHSPLAAPFRELRALVYAYRRRHALARLYAERFFSIWIHGQDGTQSGPAPLPLARPLHRGTTRGGPAELRRRPSRPSRRCGSRLPTREQGAVGVTSLPCLTGNLKSQPVLLLSLAGCVGGIGTARTGCTLTLSTPCAATLGGVEDAGWLPIPHRTLASLQAALPCAAGANVSKPSWVPSRVGDR